MDLFKVFDGLKTPIGSEENVYSAETIKGYKNHRIAKNCYGNPCLLIGVDNSKTSSLLVNQKLYNIQVLNGVECIVKRNDTTLKKCFTVISYIGSDKDIIGVFLQTVEMLIKGLGANPTNHEVKIVVNKFIELFRAFQSPPKKSIQGLWCELFLIEKSLKPDLMIPAWHNSPDEKFDFSFEKIKIEVKSTFDECREHFFSLGQLFPSKGTEIFVASILVRSSSSGLSVKDLVGRIVSKLDSSPNLSEKIFLQVYSTLGNYRGEFDETRFDYEFSKESLKIYSSDEIPKIDMSDVPFEVSNVKFKSRLFNSKEVEVDMDDLICSH